MCQPGRPGPHRRIPTRLAVLLGLPEDEIASIGFIVLVDIDAGAGAHAGQIQLCESLPYSGNLAIR